jgi:TonB family protein
MARRKRLFWVPLLAVFATVFAFPPQPLRAQEKENAETKRKVKTQVNPVYPDLARRMNVHGKVKLQVTVAPDGSVKTIHALGGHPILVGASQDAVRQWKFEPAAKETIQIVEVNFD